MPRIIDCTDQAVISLSECADAIADHGFDPDCEDSLKHAALHLRRLGNDRDFLGDILIDQLAGRTGGVPVNSAYTAQAIVLSDTSNGFFLRANIWPSENDHLYRAAGPKSFAYEAPHDHNFDFLTLGYFGPGYSSDYYEYDCDAVAGFVGEDAGLRFTGRRTLEPGQLMHYRAHLDVHSQLPPESMSVSLNVMAIDPAQSWRDQYAFDVGQGRITGILNTTSTEVFLRCAVGMGDANALDLAEQFGKSHSSDRIRLASYEARAMTASDLAVQDRLWAEAENSGSRILVRESKRRRSELAESG